MNDFYFCSPTKIYFGRDKENNVGEYIKEHGFKKVLLHYGKQSIFKTGLYDKIVNSLKKHNIEFVELGGVEANPDITLVIEGVKLCREEKVDFVLAVGGGSVIDSGKLIALGVYYDGNPLDIIRKVDIPNNHIPVGVILTIAAAGSELSASCVISDRQIKYKRGVFTELNRPLFVIENPELTYTLPRYQVGCGIVDILAHTIERYFNKSSEHEFSDYMAEGLLKSVIDASNILLEDYYNYDARSTIMLASSFSHNNLTNLGKRNLLPIHQLEHEVSALKDDVAHGAGLAVLIPAWMEKVWELDRAKFKKFALNVCNIQEYSTEEELIKKGIDYIRQLFIKLGMPTRLSEFDITKDDVEYMADHLTQNGTFVFPSDIPLVKDLVLEIFYSCL